MSPKTTDADRRSFFDALGRGVAGFLQEFNRELNGPPATEQRLTKIEEKTAALDQSVIEQDAELTAVQGRLDALQTTLQSLMAQSSCDRQMLADSLTRLEQLVGQMSAQVETLAQSQRPEDHARAARWQETLKAAGKLILLVIGPTATASALFQALVQEEIYPGLKERLLGLLSRTEGVVGPLDAPPLPPTPPTPAPRPAPTPDITPQPTQAHTPEPRRTIETTAHGPLRFDWVTVPADWFLMGSDPRRDKDARAEEQPQHRVYLPTFQIARGPVTVIQFATFVRATDHRTTAEKAGSDYTWFQPHGRSSQIGPDRAQHPVTCVSWDDAQAFCRWAKVRLPTEAEWEKAARGTAGRLFPWGDEPPDPGRCNFAGSKLGDTTPVGSYPKGVSPYGVLDLAGNVWEWCNSQWGASWDRPSFGYPYRADDGREDLTQSGLRILRGGSWYSERNIVRCAFRRWDIPVGGVGTDGFRVARSSP